MMQNAIKKFLNQTYKIEPRSIKIDFELIMTFWKTIKQIFNHEWTDHRHHLITKGIGLFSLSLLFLDIEIHLGRKNITYKEFYAIMKHQMQNIDWKLNGEFFRLKGKASILYVHNELRRYITL